MKLVFKTIIFMSFGLLGGCSWLMGEEGFFDDSQYDYTNAEITPKMEVPPSVGEANVQDHFLVPEVGEGVVGEIYGDDKDILAPMQVLTLGNKVRVNRKSPDSSAFITDSEIRIWDMIERYLATENIPVVDKNLNDSTFLTGWHVTLDDSFWSPEISGWRYRYLITLSSAPRPTEMILSVTLLEARELVDDTGTWRTFSDSKRNETEFLNSILGFMYVDNIEDSRKLVNASALGGIIVALGSDANNNPALTTSANFEHVWTRIPISLSLLNMSVDDQDRSQGLFFISQKSDDKGFFESLAFWSDDGEVLNLPEGVYRIRVASKGNQVTMTFLDDENNSFGADMLAENFPLLAKAFKSRAAE